MPRSLNVLYLLIAVIIIAGIGFLGIQVSELNDLYYAQQKNKELSALDSGTLAEKLANLEQTVAAQAKLIEALSQNVSSVQSNVALISKDEFFPAPEYGLDSSYIRVENQDASKISVVGSRERLTKWAERNEFYWDYLLKKTLPLEYDRAFRRITVVDVWPNSLFDRMGLRAGDRILSVNNLVYNQGTGLRNRLAELKDKEIALQRGSQRMVISVAFKDELKNEVSLDLNRAEFNEKLAELTALLSPVSATVSGLLSGVRLVGQVPVEANIFAQMELKPSDIITKINGTAVTGEEFFTELEMAGESFNIDYIRGNTSDQVTVLLKQ